MEGLEHAGPNLDNIAFWIVTIAHPMALKLPLALLIIQFAA